MLLFTFITGKFETLLHFCILKQKNEKVSITLSFFPHHSLSLSLAPWRTGAKHRFKHFIVVYIRLLIKFERTLLGPFILLSPVILWVLYIHIPMVVFLCLSDTHTKWKTALYHFLCLILNSMQAIFKIQRHC